MAEINRRSAVRGTAWAVPSIAVGAASPAVAASGADAYGCTSADQAKIKNYVLTTYPARLPDYTGVIMRVKHDQTLLAVDGTVQVDYISFWNVGSKTVDFTANPFNVAVDIVRDASSTNTVLNTSRSWNIDGTTTDMKMITDKGRAYPSGSFPGNSQLPTTATGDQTFYTQLNEKLTAAAYGTYGAPGSNDQTLTISFQDGIATGGRLKNAVIIRPQGFAAPTLDAVSTATGADMTKCAEAYWSAVAEWNAQAVGMRGLTFEQVAPNVSTNSNWYDADPSKTIKVSTPNGILDSRTTGNFNSGSGQAVAQNGIF